MPMGKYRKNIMIVCSSVLFFVLFAFWLHGVMMEFDITPLQGVEEMDVSGKNDNRIAGSFAPLPHGVVSLPSFGNTKFLRIPLRSLGLSGAAGSDRSSKEILLLSNPHITEVEAFVLHADQLSYTRYVFHNSLTLSDVSWPIRYPALLVSPLDREASVDDYFYLKIQSDHPLSCGVYLLDEPGFIRFYIKTSLFDFVFFAAIFSFAIVYFFLFAMTGENVYFHALMQQVCLTFLVLAFNRNLQAYWNLSFAVLTEVIWAAYSFFHISVAYGYARQLRGQAWSGRLSKMIFCVQLLLASLLLWDFFQTMHFQAFVVAAAMTVCNIAGAVSAAVMMAGNKKRHGTLLFFALSNVVLYGGFVGLFASVFHPGVLSSIETFTLSAFALAPAFYSCFLFIRTQERFHKSFSLEIQNPLCRRLSLKDPTTGLFNKAYLEYAVEENIKNALITERVFSLILIDIDCFTHFNEAWGSQEGERALALVARTIQECLREHDVAVRYGGEEFGVLLHGTAMPVAQIVAERIRMSCARRSLTLGEGRALTVSLGIALFRPDDTPKSLTLRAEEALYQAKKLGRNRTEVQG